MAASIFYDLILEVIDRHLGCILLVTWLTLIQWGRRLCKAVKMAGAGGTGIIRSHLGNWLPHRPCPNVSQFNSSTSFFQSFTLFFKLVTEPCKVCKLFFPMIETSFGCSVLDSIK